MAFALAETFARFVGLGAPVGGAFGAAALEADAFSVSFPALACALGKGKRYMVTLGSVLSSRSFFPLEIHLCHLVAMSLATPVP